MRQLLTVFATLFSLTAMPIAVCQERLVTASDSVEVARPSSADLAGLVKLEVGRKFIVSDSIRGQKDDSPDATECLEGLIMENTRQIEPLRLAHRIRPESTWLFSGKFDDVVPPECSHALAKAAGLPSEHHIEMPVDHYSGVILMPKVLLDIAKIMKSAAAQ